MNQVYVQSPSAREHYLIDTQTGRWASDPILQEGQLKVSGIGWIFDDNRCAIYRPSNGKHLIILIDDLAYPLDGATKSVYASTFGHLRSQLSISRPGYLRANLKRSSFKDWILNRLDPGFDGWDDFDDLHQIHEIVMDPNRQRRIFENHWPFGCPG